jgi:hypothetical protein
MTCIKCQHQTCKKFGYFGKRRIQRWRCQSCCTTFCDKTAHRHSHRKVLPLDKASRDFARIGIAKSDFGYNPLDWRWGVPPFGIVMLPTRLTNAFSKKLSHLKAAVALHFAYYNFCRIHSSLRITPAMEAGLTDHIWSISELLFQQHAI